MGKTSGSIFKKLALAGLVAGMVLCGNACTWAPTAPTPPTTEDTKEWFDYSTYGTNDAVNTGLVNREYFSSVYYKKLTNWYDKTESTFRDENFAAKTLKIHVTPDFTGAAYQGLEEVVNYYNNIFELANMKTRFEIVKSPTVTGTADIQFLMSSTLGTYLGTTSYYGSFQPDNLGLVATIKMNSTNYGNLKEGSELYDGYKRSLAHELGHGIGVGHNEVDQSSSMTSSPTYATEYYWRMTPNDLRCFFFELGDIVDSQEKMQAAYEFIKNEAFEFYKAMAEETYGRYGDTKLNDNTVAYYQFTLPEGTKKYKTVTVNLNDIFKGQYEATITDESGNTTTSSGAVYIVTRNVTNDLFCQEIFLDGFEYGNFQYLTSISNAWDLQLALNIGDPFTYGIRNALGLVYPTAEERDAAMAAVTAESSTEQTKLPAIATPIKTFAQIPQKTNASESSFSQKKDKSNNGFDL